MKREKCIHRGAIIFNSQLILWFTQVLEDELHLPSGQSARGTLVSYSLQLREQAVGRGDVLVKQAQGRGARCTGEVELGELAFGEGGEGKPLPINCFATLLRRDKSLVVATDAHPASAHGGGREGANRRLFKLIQQLQQEGQIRFTQLIWEGNGRWIHISHVPSDLRCQVIGE